MADLLIPPQLREDHRRGLQRQLEQSGGGRLVGAQVELTGMRAGGEVFPIELAVTRIDTDDLPLFTAFVRDITDRKRAEEELRRSRARIVNAGDDARRRLERNLHDGAQQRLVSLSLSLRLARIAVPARPGGGRSRSWRRPARSCHRRWRSCASWRGASTPRSSPTAACARRWRRWPAASPVPVELERCPSSHCRRRSRRPPTTSWRRRSPTLPSTPRPNTLRSASCVPTGRRRSRSADDGVGGADPPGGTGLRGLADRVEALDGTLAVQSNGSGTRVSAVIPCG